jgi:ATP/ADP translocase
MGLIGNMDGSCLIHAIFCFVVFFIDRVLLNNSETSLRRVRKEQNTQLTIINNNVMNANQPSKFTQRVLLLLLSSRLSIHTISWREAEPY